MPKMKTKKAIKKRVKITASGKVLRHRAGAGHLKSRKSATRLRKMREKAEVKSTFAKHAKRLLGM
jgi:large subunit ribosomal protein L35